MTTSINYSTIMTNAHAIAKTLSNGDYKTRLSIGLVKAWALYNAKGNGLISTVKQAPKKEVKEIETSCNPSAVISDFENVDLFDQYFDYCALNDVDFDTLMNATIAEMTQAVTSNQKYKTAC